MNRSRACVCAAVALLALGCGDSTDPGSTGSLAGLWQFTFSGTLAVPSGTLSCHTSSVAKVLDIRDVSSSDWDALVPQTAVSVCGADTIRSAFLVSHLIMRQQDDQLTILLDGADSFAVATYHGTTISGHISNPRWAFVGSTLSAIRCCGSSDPNLEPFILEVGSAWPDLEVADSVLVGALPPAGGSGDPAGAAASDQLEHLLTFS